MKVAFLFKETVSGRLKRKGVWLALADTSLILKCPRNLREHFEMMMFRIYLAISIMSVGLGVTAQPNMYKRSVGKLFVRLPVVENLRKVYFTDVENDTLSNGIITKKYYLTAVDKFNSYNQKSLLVVTDTVFNRYEEFQPNAVMYCASNGSNKLTVFILTDKDSSANPIISRKYPKSIATLILDEDLNIVRPYHLIHRDSAASGYVINTISIPQQLGQSHTVLLYDVRDTFITTGLIPNSHACKYTIIDSNGNPLKDGFIIYEPQKFGNIFYDHGSSDVLNKTHDGNVSALLNFEDSTFAPIKYCLAEFDTAMNFMRYMYMLPILDPVPVSNGFVQVSGNAITLAYLPSGSLLRNSLGYYVNTTTSKYYSTYVIAKSALSDTFSPTTIYVPPFRDSLDTKHSANHGLQGAVYNSYDNRVYVLSATNSDADNLQYCADGTPNAGQIVCLDTNLNELWVKYLNAPPQKCVVTYSVSAPSGRGGVLISGSTADLRDLEDLSAREGFIYYVDSSTRLGISKQSPIGISNKFEIFPNPARDFLTIQSMESDKYSWAIINSLGQTMMAASFTGLKCEINVQSLAKGIYCIKISSKSGNQHSQTVSIN